MVVAEECWHKSLAPLMEEVRQQMGEGPVYLSFDIDAIDPGFCPGTGKWKEDRWQTDNIKKRVKHREARSKWSMDI